MIRIPCFSQSVTQPEELSVINDTFLELLGTDYFLIPAPPTPYAPIHPDSVDAEIIEVKDDSLTIELDGVDYSLPSLNEDSIRTVEIEAYEKFDWEKYYKELNEYKAFLDNRPLDTADLV